MRKEVIYYWSYISLELELVGISNSLNSKEHLPVYKLECKDGRAGVIYLINGWSKVIGLKKFCKVVENYSLKRLFQISILLFPYSFNGEKRRKENNGNVHHKIRFWCFLWFQWTGTLLSQSYHYTFPAPLDSFLLPIYSIVQWSASSGRVLWCVCGFFFPLGCRTLLGCVFTDWNKVCFYRGVTSAY